MPVSAREFLAGRPISPGTRFVRSSRHDRARPHGGVHARSAMSMPGELDLPAALAAGPPHACRTSAIERWRPIWSRARCAGSGSSTISSRTSPSGPLARLDFEVLQILRLGAYQLLHLDRVPAAAAVNDAVAMTRRARKTSAAGLVNAVLRAHLANFTPRCRFRHGLRMATRSPISRSRCRILDGWPTMARPVWVRTRQKPGSTSTTPPLR